MMAEGASGLVLCWYYHLPTACDADEVIDLAKRSIKPLLHAHRRCSQPLVLAITGTLLRRLSRVAPEVVEAISVLRDEGLCEVAATCLHEVYPPVVPLRHLSSHIMRDLEVKEQVLGASPSIFYPPNLVWVGALERILPSHGLEGVILDAAHYRLTASAQTWRWSASDIDHIASVPLDPRVDPRELWRVVAYRPTGSGASASPLLRCFFRDNHLVERFSFGNASLIHRVDGEVGLRDFAEEVRTAVSQGHVVTLADDGDRVNPLSLRGYESFLERLGAGSCVLTGSAFPGLDDPEINYLPSFAMDGLDELLRGGADSNHYLALLEEVYRSGPLVGSAEEDLLALQDVFFLFWKTLPRKGQYLERLLNLHASITQPDNLKR